MTSMYPIHIPTPKHTHSTWQPSISTKKVHRSHRTNTTSHRLSFFRALMREPRRGGNGLIGVSAHWTRRRRRRAARASFPANGPFRVPKCCRVAVGRDRNRKLSNAHGELGLFLSTWALSARYVDVGRFGAFYNL